MIFVELCFVRSCQLYLYVIVAAFRAARQLRLPRNFSRKSAYVKKGVIV